MSKFGQIITNTPDTAFGGGSVRGGICWIYIYGKGSATFNKPKTTPGGAIDAGNKTITIKIDITVKCVCEKATAKDISPGLGISGVKCSGNKLTFAYQRSHIIGPCNGKRLGPDGFWVDYKPCASIRKKHIEKTITATELLAESWFKAGTDYCIYWSPGGPNQKLALELAANCNAITTGDIPDGPFKTCVSDSPKLAGCLENLLFTCKAKDLLAELIEKSLDIVAYNTHCLASEDD